MSTNAPRHRRRFPRLFQRGVGSTEYVLYLSLTIMVGSLGYKQYGPELRQHAAKMSERFATYYYEGWFWPEDDLATDGGSGTPRAGSGTGSNAGPSQGAPSSPGSSGGGNPLAGGNGSPGAGEGGGSSGGQTGNAGSGGNPNNGGTNNTGGNTTPGNSGGAGSEPQMCSAGGGTGGGNTSNPFGSPSTGAAANASSFSSIGNPIDLGTGNKYQIETDYTGSGTDSLVFVRSYNSVLADRDTGLGHGWRHSYQRSLVIDPKQRTLTVWRDDGTQYPFTLEKGNAGAPEVATAPVGVIDRLERTPDGWTYRTASGDTEHYSADGHLQQIITAAGHTQTLNYQPDGRLQSITDHRGQRLTLHWDRRHLSAVTTPTGERLHYRYDDHNNLQAQHRSRGVIQRTLNLLALGSPERRYHYEDKRHDHALTGLDDATGARYATWGYDHLGRANLSQHGDGAEKITLDYRNFDAQAQIRTVAVTNAAGHTVVYTLEAARPGKYRMRDIDGQSGLDCPAVQNHHRYDDHGFLARQYNADRIGSTYRRNARGLIEQETHGLRFDEREIPQPAPGSRRIERTYSSDSATQAQLLTETHASWQIDDVHPQGRWQASRQQRYSYDDRGRLLSTSQIDLTDQTMPYQTHGTTRTQTYAYTWHDAAQTDLKILTVTDGNGHATTYHYQHDQLQRLTNALQQTTHFSDYTTDGQPQRLQLPNGQTLHITYNAQGLPTQLRRLPAPGQSDQNAGPETTEVAYDAAGRLISLTRPDGSEQTYTYNTASQLTQIKNGWGDTLALTPNVLNGQWEQQQLSDEGGNLIQRHHRRYNALGQLAAVLGNAGQHTAFSYDANGNRIDVREGPEDPAQSDSLHSTEARYDTQGRLLALIDAAGYSTRYRYSASGHLAAITDANQNATHYTRNGFGEIIEQDSPTTGSMIKRYDGNGNLIENRSAGGDGIHFEYDALNRLTKVDYPGIQNDIQYVYDQADTDHGNGLQQLTRIDTQTQTIDYRYDGLGRKIAETTTDKTPPLPAGEGQGVRATKAPEVSAVTTLKYDYLPGNRLSTLTYPDGSVVTYRYDKERVDEVTYTDKTSGSSHTILTDIAYTPFGGPVAWTYGNGLTQRKTLDLDGRIQAIDLTADSFTDRRPVWSQRYTHDLYQNIVAIQRTGNGKAQEQEQEQRFAYDELNRLTQEMAIAGAANSQANNQGQAPTHIDYAYDALGNRVGEQRDETSRQYTYGSGNQLQAAGDQPLLMEGGNTLIEKTPSDLRYTLYDRNNRARAFYKNKQLTATYAYDARGWRHRKTTRATPTGQPVIHSYAYTPDGKLLSEATGSQAASRQSTTHYIWLGDEPVAQINRDNKQNNAHVTYLHSDHLRTARVASNDDQHLVWRWQGDAFGHGQPDEDLDQDGQLTRINLRFPGQYADTESGLYYNLHRYYDPEKGRYTQSDLLGLADGTNSFAYVHGNPLSGVDPLGLYNAYTHFYMTYFLAITSGLPQDTALKIALATQYVDENSATQPTSVGGALNGALDKYHFTLDYDENNHGDTGSNPLTRFQNPSSNQLSRLHSITDKAVLEKMWLEAHPSTVEGECPMPNQGEMNKARYQFYGEYLHAFEDTFAHRDMNNMSYDKWSFNDDNTGGAIIGHIGLMPGGWEAPDQTFNNSMASVPQECKKQMPGPPKNGGPTYTYHNDYNQAQCTAWGGAFTPGGSWQYNELRTLRMEYEVFAKLQTDFATEIAQNKANGGKAATWNDLAGANGWDASASRVGGSAIEKGQFSASPDAAKLHNVLQQFNASGNADKYKVLNDWLVSHGYGPMPKLAVTGHAGTIEEESELNGTNLFNQAQTNRTESLKWIPQQTQTTSGVPGGTTAPGGKHYTESEFGVILPPNTGGQLGNATPVWN